MATHPSFEHWMQSRLTAHGFPVGIIDGDVGTKTIKALKAFEAHHGFPADGTADADVVDMLRTSATLTEPYIPERDVVEVDNDPGLIHNMWPIQSRVPDFYGAVGKGQVRLDLPYSMRLAWDRSIKVARITVHHKVKDSAERAFNKIADTYSHADRVALGLDIFGGSLNVRRMRGGTRYSMHSWGIAIDFDPERNQLKWKAPKPRLSHKDARPFWEIWEAEGWVSLGRERNFDWMHVQAARLR